jgi:seryl-tRNA synthetase
MSLRQEIDQQRKEVDQFREALWLLENPQRYGPKPGELPPLDFLKLQLSEAKEDRERERLLQLSRQTLSDAEQRLAEKEQQLQQLESDCEAIAEEMKLAAESVLRAESAYHQSLQDFENWRRSIVPVGSSYILAVSFIKNSEGLNFRRL